MERQRLNFWTGGLPHGAEGCEEMAAGFPAFAPPARLSRAVRVVFQWGGARFEFAVAACSVRTAPWGREPMAWLHCKAAQTSAITPDEPTRVMTLLIPAHYVTAVWPGPALRFARHRNVEEEIGVFPPNQPAPADALPLSEIERAITDLLVPERN